MEDAQKNSAGTNTDNKLHTPIKQGKKQQRHEIFRNLGKKNGASERIRTVDSHVGNVILYQLSYTRTLKEAVNKEWSE